MKTTCILLVLIQVIALQSLSGQSTVKGVVYEDLNKNGIRDRRERGIAEVQVSNGIDVVNTNIKGEYLLPLSDDNIIFVIKPSAYSLPVNEFNQPLFFYNHKPNGSPALKYQGVAPTGPLPESVDFALIPAVREDTFRILVFGDPQPKNIEEVDYFSRGIMSEIENTSDAIMGISLGDLSWDNPDLYPHYKKAIKRAGIPWHNVMGNHDENYDVTCDSLSDESFEREFGPATYSFNHGNVHFLILDDILYPDPRDGIGYWGGFTKRQLSFIENDLRYVPKDKLIVLAFHIPLAENEGGDSFRDEDREALFSLLKDFQYTLSLSAHTHFQTQLYLTRAEGWQRESAHHQINVGTTCGDWHSGIIDVTGVPAATMRDGTEKGYLFISFNGNKYSAKYKVAGKDPDYQFRIYAPRVVEQNKRTTSAICVNFFMGERNDTVYYRVDEGKWQPMIFFEDYDPSYLHLLHEWDYTDTLLNGRRPSNPVKCTHLWRGIIPTNLDAGTHTIEIKATDKYGQTFTQKSSYMILKKETN